MAAGDTVITLVGNLVDDPELRFTPSGAAVAKFRVASTPRFLDRQTNEWKDGESLFLTCNVWRQAAENRRVAAAWHAGGRTGAPQAALVRDQEGEKRTVYEVEVDEVGPSLRNATAKVSKTTRSGGGSGGSRRFDRGRRPMGVGRAERRRLLGQQPQPGLLRRATVLDLYLDCSGRTFTDGKASNTQAEEEGLRLL
jgi:single-strand DNA-binding protein